MALAKSQIIERNSGLARHERVGGLADDPEIRREFRELTETVVGATGVGGPWFTAALLLSAGAMGIGAVSWWAQLNYGLEVTGLQHPMMWAMYISSFVWWVGVAHSGTMVSAILFLFRARFRPAFSRTAEAMTLIAIVTATAFPIIHLGRAWRFYWLLPYPNQRHLWPTFRSPLLLDVFAILTYLLVSVMFFWLGLVPDLAIMRDRAKGWARTLYGIASLGWQGKGNHWHHHHMAYGIIASLATPLVISVHTVVSWDFSLGITAGWHSTIFPPFFVLGAVFSGLAMVLTLMLPMRALLGLKRYITLEHLDWLARLILLMSLLLSFCYATEYFMIWYGRDQLEKVNLLNRMTTYGPLFWTMTLCNSVFPLSLFLPKLRRNVRFLFVLSLLVNLGMWLERFVVVAGSLARDYEPYAWAREGYHVMLVEWGIIVGSYGFFFFCFLLFVRHLPTLPIAEYKRELLKEKREQHALEAAGLEREP
jgi:Ni/Fe-hydrogenase subunit HybB-like protein